MLKYIHDFITAFEAILHNRIKSFLTTLGIIFGVAAVISMLAIGKGAQKEILDQIKLVGVNNIVISPISKPQSNEQQDDKSDKKEVKKFAKGLSILDEEAIYATIPTVARISAEINKETHVIQNGIRVKANLIGIDSPYFDLFKITLTEGKYFNNFQFMHGEPVCIIGNDINTRIFNKIKSIGSYVKCGDVWLRVVGVIEKRPGINLPGEKDEQKNFNNNVYIPTKTMLLRFQNRGLITENMIKGGKYGQTDNASYFIENTNNIKENQLDKIIVQVKEFEDIEATVDLLNRIMLRRHTGVTNYEVKVPELLLRQQQRTKDIFNIVLGAIAAISLLVGGIGIMNIMLASVLERVREIGIRQAIGATRKDIMAQFLSEAVLISVSGGIIGVIAGIILSKLITEISGVLTIITWYSVALAFFISVAVGIVFGYVPAKNAARRDPVESLRYE